MNTTSPATSDQIISLSPFDAKMAVKSAAALARIAKPPYIENIYSRDLQTKPQWPPASFQSFLILTYLKSSPLCLIPI